jgi:outer membrane protein assembly factor BamB
MHVISPLLIMFASSLMMSGCFSSPTKSEEQKEEKLHLLWEYAYDLDGGAPLATPIVVDEQYIISSGDINITSLNVEDGKLEWKTSFEHHRQLTSRTLAIHNDIIVGSITRQVLGWNKYTGEELWSVTIHDSMSWSFNRGITKFRNRFLIPGQGKELYFISPDGILDVEELDVRSYETTLSDGVLYAGQRRGYPGVGLVSAYDAESMERLWRFEPDGFGFPTRAAPIVEDGVVYVGTTGGPDGARNGFFALDAVTGHEFWRREGMFTYSAELVGDFIYVNDAAGIYKLRKADGGVEWYSDFRAGAGTTPIAYGYGYLYAPHSGTLHVVDAQTGEVVHRLSPPDGSYFWLVTAGAGRVFVQSNRRLYAFAPWGHEEPLE